MEFRHLLHLFLGFFILCMGSCTSPLELKGFDANAWKQDANGCLGVRDKLVERLLEHKEYLIGKEDLLLTELLGPPERTDQGVRSRKQLIYFISSGSQCAGRPGSEGQKLVLEFDALGRLKILRIEVI